MTNIIFTAEATENLIAQARYIYEQTLDTNIADKYILTMKAHIVQMLTHFPKAGRPAEEFGVGIRKLVHNHYSILYIIGDLNITVISIYKDNLPNL